METLAINGINAIPRRSQAAYAQRAIAQRYRKYEYNAKQRGLEFRLTLSEFGSFWKKWCFYCRKRIATVALDRVDNTRGYAVDNVVPCCKQCNFAKRDLGLKEYIEHCRRVSERWEGENLDGDIQKTQTMADGTETKALFIKNFAKSDWEIIEQLRREHADSAGLSTIADVVRWALRKVAGRI